MTQLLAFFWLLGWIEWLLIAAGILIALVLYKPVRHFVSVGLLMWRMRK